MQLKLQRYVPRLIDGASLEDRVEEALNHGFCALVGFPGIGKTTTARYVSAKLASEGKNVVWLVPDPAMEPGVRVDTKLLLFEDGVKGDIIETRISHTHADVWRFYEFLWLIAEMAEKPEKYRRKLEKFWKRFASWLQKEKRELADRILMGGKAVEIASFSGEHTKEFVDALTEFIEKEGLYELVEGMEELWEGIIKALAVKPENVIGRLKLSLREDIKGTGFAREVAEKIAGMLESAGVTMEEFTHRYSHFIFIGISGLLGLTGALELVKLRRRMREEKKRKHIHRIVGEKLERVKDRVVFVVDDLEDTKKEHELDVAFQEIVKIILHAECPLLMVRRFSTKLSNRQQELVEEIAGVVGGAREFSRNLRKHTVLDILGIEGWERMPEIRKEQIQLMLTATYEEFEDILRANLPEEKLKELGKGGIEELWRKFCMNPHLAIALVEQGVKLEEIKAEGEPHYHKKLAVELRKEDIEQMTAWQVTGFRLLYKRIRKEKPYLIPLSFHPVAEDEVKVFLQEFTDRPKEFMEQLELSAGESEVLMVKEGFRDGIRNLYYLDENAQKLGIYFRSLAEFDDIYLKDMAKIRLTLLRIMTKEAKKAGGRTERMLFASISDAEFLLAHSSKIEPVDIGALEEELERLVLFWARIGLEYDIFNPEYLKVAERCLSLGRNVLYALEYVRSFVERLRVSVIKKKENFLNYLQLLVEKVKVKRESELALKLQTVAAILAAIVYETGNEQPLEELDTILLEAERIKSKMLRSFTLLYLKDRKLEILQLLFDAQEEKRVCIEMQKEIRKLKAEVKHEIDIETEDYLMIAYGGYYLEKVLPRLITWWEAQINCTLGRIYLELENIKSTKRFQTAFKLHDELTDYGNAVVCLSGKHRAEVCLDWQLGGDIDLRELRSYFRRNISMCTHETISTVCAELIMADALKNQEFEEDLLQIVFPEHRTLLIGMLALIGKWDKSKAVDELRKVDVSPLPADSLHTTIRILRLYLKGEIDKARHTATVMCNIYQPLSSLLNRLFSQAAEALKNNDEDKFKEAMVKLFFYHV